MPFLGVNVAVGNVNGDGFADIVTGPTAGNPDVRVFNGYDIANHNFHPNDSSLLAQWFPYALQFNVGATVAVGDIYGTGFGDMITGATSGNPQVKVYDGQAIADSSLTRNTAESHVLDQFFAYALNQGIGVSVGASDFETNGHEDILTGARNGPPTFRVVRGTAMGVMPPALFEGTVTGFPNGITVGAAG